MYKTVSNIAPYYLSKSLDLREPKHKGLRSQHNFYILRTFKKLAIRLFPLLDHVYGTLFLFRSGTLNQLIFSKSNWKPICIHYRYCFIMSSCCIVFLYTYIVYVFLISALCNLRKRHSINSCIIIIIIIKKGKCHSWKSGNYFLKSDIVKCPFFRLKIQSLRVKYHFKERISSLLEWICFHFERKWTFHSFTLRK